MAQHNTPSIILASASQARQKMLQNAGINFRVFAANLDEQRLTEELLQKDFAAEKIALMLAEQKALLVSSHDPHALIIGADSIVECQGQLISKAANIEEAKNKLRLLRGQTHYLTSAISVVLDHEILWSHAETAALTMNDFDDEFLDAYCKKAGFEALTTSVGAYQLENLGSQLFETIKGDYFTILGLPLLPLLHYLKKDQDISL